MSLSSKEQFLRAWPQYGYGHDADAAQPAIDRLRAQEFAHMQGSVYLDHAGATMYSSAQLQSAFAELSTGVFGNPHSQSHAGDGERASTAAKVERVRHQAMAFFCASEEEYELVFTSGATAALKLVGECFPWQQDSTFAHSMDSHTSVLGIRGYARKHGASISCVALDEMKRLEEAEEEANDRERTARASNSNEQGVQDETANPPMNLFAFPAECNFSGARHSLSLVDRVQNGALDTDTKQKWLVLLDAAKYVSTRRLDLSSSSCKPDFVVLSFYKMFGYPTGLGALLVKKNALRVLRKEYYGGGTVQSILATQNLVIPRGMTLNGELQSAAVSGAARFGDGTQSFLSILSLRHGLDQLERLGMDKIEAHATALTRLLYSTLTAMKHWNGRSVCEIYGNHSGARGMQGSIVACNFLRPDGSYVGYSEVSKLAAIHSIQLRTGCFCNPGACQSYLRLRDEDLLAGIDAGHVCGDDMDLLDGLPTGAVRLSIGYMTSYEDIAAFIDFVTKYFVSIKQPAAAASSARLPQPHESEQVRLTKITLFPIKSCSGMSVDAWPVGSRGLLFDREWAIVDTASSKALSLKELPELCFVRPRVDLKQQTLTITFQKPAHDGASAAPADAFVLPLAHADTRRSSSHAASKDAIDTARDMRVCAGACKGRDVGLEVSQWLSARLKRQCALMRVAPTHLRDSQAQQPKHSSSKTKSSSSPTSSDASSSSKIGFANQAQYLLISRASIADLNVALRAAANDDSPSAGVDEDAFRANLIVDGCDAFAEDAWTRLRIGHADHDGDGDGDAAAKEAAGVTFDVSGPCSRCAMINVDPRTGAFSRAPLQTLSTYRRERSSIFFGQFLTRRASSEAAVTTVTSPGAAASIKWVHVGDAISVSSLKRDLRR